MPSNEEIRYFSAVTYDNNVYHFSINSNDEIYCDEFGITFPSKIIELKPNFVLRNELRRSIYSLDDYCRERNKKKSLIREYVIDAELYEYLINKRMLMYSTDMAILYGFDPQYAHDAHYQTRAFKHVKDKSRRLAKQKHGKFH